MEYDNRTIDYAEKLIQEDRNRYGKPKMSPESYLKRAANELNNRTGGAMSLGRLQDMGRQISIGSFSADTDEWVDIGYTTAKESKKQIKERESRELLNELSNAKDTIEEMKEILTKIQDEPLILHVTSKISKRGTGNGVLNSTIVPMFLTEMDGLEESSAIVMIATNRPDILDPAIVRDGRIDRKISVDRPNFENGARILHMNMKNIPIHKSLNSDELAVSVAKSIYSNTILKDIVNGAMLAGIVDLAISNAFKRDIEKKEAEGVMQEDFTLALERMQEQNKDIQHNFHREVA